MSSVTGDCSVDGCENLATRQTPHGPLCDAHRKRTQPSRDGGTPLFAPVQKRLSPRKRLLENAIGYADASSEDDDDAQRAEDRLAKGAIAYARELHAADVKAALQAKRRAGVQLGRKPKLDRAAAEHAVRACGGVRKAALALGVDKATVQRALKRSGAERVVSPHGDMHTLKFSPPSD